MEKTDNRKRTRLNPNGVNASVFIVLADGKEIMIEGLVVDLSYGGIKIKLNEPIIAEFQQANLSITLKLPESGISVSIRGLIKHVSNLNQYGLEFMHDDTENELDELMFECVKYSSHYAEN